MTLLNLMLLVQVHGDTLRWYTTEPAYFFEWYREWYWAVNFYTPPQVVGRTIHSGRFYLICDNQPPTGTLSIYKGAERRPETCIVTETFYFNGPGWYEVFFGDSLVLQAREWIWLVCHQEGMPYYGFYVGTMDSGPVLMPYRSWVSMGNDSSWISLTSLCYPYDYNWVMEIILTPLDVEEGQAKPEEKLALVPAPGGFWITGYEGPAWIYDPAGRLVLSREIKGKTLISPLRSGVYFVVAGKERAKAAVQ